jgi:hypothetical protein
MSIAVISRNDKAPSCHVCEAIMKRNLRPDGKPGYIFQCLACGATTDPDSVQAYVAPAPASLPLQRSHIVTTFLCKVCDVQKKEANHWFLVSRDEYDGSHAVAIGEWDQRAEQSVKQGRCVPVCGEAHAQVLISRWFKSRTFEPETFTQEKA